MESRLYLLTDDKVKFCLKKLKSFKATRWVTPLIVLPINYCFILYMIGIDDHNQFLPFYRILPAYLILCIFTTLGFFFIGTAGIKRYRNFITEIKIAESGNIEFNTLIGNTISIKNGEYKTTNDLLSLNRNNKFKVYVIILGEENFSLVAEWFNDQKELDDFFRVGHL